VFGIIGLSLRPEESPVTTQRGSCRLARRDALQARAGRWGKGTSFAVTVRPTVETGSVVAQMHLADDASATRQARQYARLFGDNMNCAAQ